jgi:adenosylcobyric acid synthase
MSAALMVQGTASGVGKSLMTAALCRIFSDRGWCVAPFKAQNMSNNAGATASGLEIARAQLLQARAARVQPDVRMNPVLLKPLNERTSDVVVLGRSSRELRDLPWHDRKAILWPVVAASYDALRASFDLVIIEGAGSPAETNLRRSDIVNMDVAHYADARVIVVADIDRGGAFAALYGTWAVLDERDRNAIGGFLLNRFRGDPALLEPAPRELERRTGVPTLGCVPFLAHRLPDEDAFSLAHQGSGELIIAAVRLPHLSNFDDLDPLAAQPGVSVRWISHPAELDGASAIVLPGTRNTIDDLEWLWSSGLGAAIRARMRNGATQLVGLCGGFQMLGRTVSDPHAIEAGGSCHGLGVLDMETVLEPDKHVCETSAALSAWPFDTASPARPTLDGYEIHHGETRVAESVDVWLRRGDSVLGAYAPNCWGTYLHGLFANDEFRVSWIASLGGDAREERWAGQVERELDRLAAHVAAHVDLTLIERWVRR